MPPRNFSFIPRQKMAFHVPEQRVGGVFAASRSETLVAMFVAMLNRLCAARFWRHRVELEYAKFNQHLTVFLRLFSQSCLSFIVVLIFTRRMHGP